MRKARKPRLFLPESRAYFPRLDESRAYPKYGDGIEWKLKQDVDFLRDA